jgi:hypothetical protein
MYLKEVVVFLNIETPVALMAQDCVYQLMQGKYF